MPKLESLVIPTKVLLELHEASQKRRYNVEMDRVLEKYEGRKYHKFMVDCKNTLVLLRRIKRDY